VLLGAALFYGVRPRSEIVLTSATVSVHGQDGMGPFAWASLGSHRRS
jgi:hypothetical protein